MEDLIIGSRKIGNQHPCFIIAEVSANHNQDINRAKKIIEAAKKAGADAVKLQTYMPDTMTIDCDNEYFQIPSNSIWTGKTLFQLYKEAFTPWDWHAELFQYAKELDLICFSTPFDKSSVLFLEKLNVPLYKVASFELIDFPLLKEIGKCKKPVILSTGMASLSETSDAVNTLQQAGAGPIVLLKCTSAYPASPSSMNLRTIPHLSETFHTHVGLSDHTMGSAAALVAVSLGAKVIEKHFTLLRSDGGADSSFSLEPEEFADMVRTIRFAEQALGKISYGLTEEEQKNICFRRSLFAIQDINIGDSFSLQNVGSIRPGYGLHPRYLSVILGKKVTKLIKRGTPLSWELVGESV